MPYIPIETASAYYKRIGNMVLMNSTTNSTIGNAGFDEKKEAFRMAPFPMTSMVAEFDKWGPVDIDDRQKILAKWAVKTWPIRVAD